MADNDTVVVDLDAEDSGLVSTLAEGTDAIQEFASSAEDALSGIEIGEEVDTDVARLTDAINQLAGQMGKAGDEAQGFSDDTEDVDEKSGDLLGTLGKFGMVLSGIKAGWDMVSGACMAALDVFNGWIDAAAESELAEQRLRAVHRAAGDAVGYSADQLLRMSEALQETTRFEAETVQGAQAVLLAFKNVRGDIFADATKSAADLAEGLGMDLVGATRLLGKALQEPGEGLMGLRRAGVTFTDSQIEMIKTMTENGQVMEAQTLILAKVKDSFGGVAESIGETHAGKWERFNNRVGDIIESLGGALIPVMDSTIPLLEDMATAAENLVPVFEAIVEAAKGAKDGLLSYLKPVFEWLVETLIGTEAVIETVIMKWQDVFSAAGASIAYTLVKMYNEVEYYIVDVIPGLLDWFAHNWVEIFTDLFNAHNKILENMGKNTWEFIKSVKDMLMGGSGEFKFVGLLEGFESTLEELPIIAARVEGEVERNLREEMERASTELGEDFQKRFERNKKFVEGLFTKKEKEKEDMVAKPDLNFEVDGPKPEKEKKDKEAKDKEEKAKEEESKNRLEGIQELARRIEMSGVKRPEDKVVAAIEKAAEEAKKDAEVAKLEADSIGRQYEIKIEEVNTTLKTEVAATLSKIEEEIGELVTEAESSRKQSIMDAVDAIMKADEKAAARDKRTHDLMQKVANASESTQESTKKVADGAIPAVYS